MEALGPDNFDVLLCRIESRVLHAVARHWHEARGGRRMPSWADLKSQVLSPYLKMTWGFDFDIETGEITGRSTGSRFGKWMGENFTGGRLQDIYDPANYAECYPFLSRVVMTPLAIRCSGCLFTVDNFTVIGERIVLPMAGDGNTGDGILGVSSYAPPPLLGSFRLIHENVEWYAIDRI
jgi:hypothetical protein